MPSVALGLMVPWYVAGDATTRAPGIGGSPGHRPKLVRPIRYSADAENRQDAELYETHEEVAGGGPDERCSWEPPTEHAAWRWMGIGVGGFIAAQVLATVFLGVVGALAHRTKSLASLAAQAEPPAWVVVSQLVGIWTGFVGAAVLVARTSTSRTLARALGLKFKLVDPLLGLAAGIAGQFLVDLAYLPLVHASKSLQKQINAPAQRLTGGFHGWGFWLIGVLTVCVVPVVEELLFRGVFLRALLRMFGALRPRSTDDSLPAGTWKVRHSLAVTSALIADGLIFGLAHFELIQLPGLALFGALLALLAYKTKRLGPSIFAHAGFNLIAVVWIGSSGWVRY